MNIACVIRSWNEITPSYHERIIALLVNEGYNVFIFGENIPKNHLNDRRLVFTKFDIKALIRILFNVQPKVLIIFHLFGSPVATLLMFLSKILKIKVVVVPDIAEAHLPRLHRSLSSIIIEPIRFVLYLSQILLADIIVCFTEYEKYVLSKIYLPENKIQIIPIGCDFRIKTSNKENYILTVSKWWHDRKNLHTILKIFSKIIKKYKNYKLVVVGDFHGGLYYIPEEDRWESGKEYKQKIIKLVDDLNLKNNVEFVGIKTGRELEELFRKAKIFYLPSKFETFGMVFVEAMASGTPIVAMKNSAVQYVIKDGVTGFLRNTEEGQKDAILMLLTDKKLYKQMQKNCLKEAIEYKWENIIKKWIKVIDGLVGSRR